MRIRYAMAAGTAVALLSAATTLMASASAASGVTTAVAAPSPATVNAVQAVHAGSGFGSAAGLLLGLLFVLVIAAVRYHVQVGAGRRAPARVITVPEARVSPRFIAAYAD
ncbi:MAG: hypothetical protein ABI912_08895 [Actinomycetota bacterium]